MRAGIEPRPVSYTHLDVYKRQQHGHHIEAHAESSAGIAHSHNSALVGGQLGRRIAMPSDEPGGYDHSQPKPERCKNLQEQRKILPVVRDHRGPAQKIPGKFHPAH